MRVRKPDPRGGACVLVSGGADSAVLLSDALTRHARVVPLYIRSRLLWEPVELYWLKRLLRRMRSPRLEALRILEVPMSGLYKKHWSLTGKSVPGRGSRDEEVYLPGRNIVLLSQAAVFAAVNGLAAVEIGVLKANPFGDSSPAFLKALGKAVSMGLGRSVGFYAPLRSFKKEAVLERGRRLPLGLSFSCIDPKGKLHCGDCNKCMERKLAFFRAGIKDPTKYKKAGL